MFLVIVSRKQRTKSKIKNKDQAKAFEVYLNACGWMYLNACAFCWMVRPSNFVFNSTQQNQFIRFHRVNDSQSKHTERKSSKSESSAQTMLEHPGIGPKIWIANSYCSDSCTFKSLLLLDKSIRQDDWANKTCRIKVLGKNQWKSLKVLSKFDFGCCKSNQWTLIGPIVRKGKAQKKL